MNELDALVEGIDGSFWDAVPSPVKPTQPPTTPTKKQKIDLTDFLAGDWNLDDDPFTPQKPKAAPKPPPVGPEPTTRCVVDAVLDDPELVDGRWSRVIHAHVYKKEEDARVVYLHDDWYDTPVRAGDTINVIGHWSPSQTITITSQSGMLILHPDTLLTATSLSNSTQCTRKPLLSSLVRSSNDITPALVWGNMLHEIMQRCLLSSTFTTEYIEDQIDSVIVDGLGNLVLLNISEETARATLRARTQHLPDFAHRYLGDTPKPEGTVSDTRAKNGDVKSTLAIKKIHEVEEDIWSPKYGLKGKLDVTVEVVVDEEGRGSGLPVAKNGHARSGFFKAGKQTTLPSMKPLQSHPRPFEIKTGRSIGGMEHRAQTMLYTLLASERYGVEVDKGLLFYTQSDGGEIVQVPRGRNEIRGLMVIRNELASWMMVRSRKKDPGSASKTIVDVPPSSQPESDDPDMEEAFLPAPIDQDHACKRCYVIDSCMLYRYALSTSSQISASSAPTTTTSTFTPINNPSFKSLESAPDPSSSLSQTYEIKTGHLKPEHGLFFRQWERLLSLEERDLGRWKSELWRLGAEERERRGRCFGGMVMLPEEEKGWEMGTMVGNRTYKYAYTFAKSRKFQLGTQGEVKPMTQDAESSTQQPSSSLLNGHLSVGDAITLSVEPYLLALVQGFIVDLAPESVTVGVDHIVDLEAVRERVQVLRRRYGVEEGEEEDEEVIFRIDKDELFGGMARMRNNLAQLFFVDGDHKRRELIVDLRPPAFAPEAGVDISSAQLGHLNQSQQYAIHKVLTAEDYALILGMPGTGKTTVVAALIKVLVESGKTVLLASYTHSAVDSILRKLDEGEGEWSEKVLRLGNVDKVHKDARKFTLAPKEKASTVQGLEKQWMTPPVVAATCLGVDHPLFAKRQFDYCIVDEASQITLPTCLGPLRHAKTFILVGDHFQLPPLVKNPDARAGGLDVSLFRRLSDAHPNSVVDLNQQYRMNQDIMLLSNKLIYDDRLKCGNERVARRALDLPNRLALDLVHKRMKRQLGAVRCKEVEELGQGRGGCWLEHLVDPGTKAVFVDTDALGPAAYDSRAGDLVQNVIEASLVVQFVETLVRCGVLANQIGIISLYRQQVKLIMQKLAGREPEEGREESAGESDPGLGGVEVLTADKSQGRDKDCIVVSLVRSNAENQIGELVKDWRRMNVSFTRARSKLVIFGSRSTLQGDPLLAQFFELMDVQGWVYGLPKDAHLFHEADSGQCEGGDEDMEYIKGEGQGVKLEDGEEVKIEEEELKIVNNTGEDTAEPLKLKEEIVKLEHMDNEVEIVASSDDIIIVDQEPEPRKMTPLKRSANMLNERIEIYSEDEHDVLMSHGSSSWKFSNSNLELASSRMEVDDDEVGIVSTGPFNASSIKPHGKGKEKENRPLSSNPSSSTSASKSKPPAAQMKSKPTAKPNKSKGPTASSSSSSAPRTNQSKLDGWFKNGTVKKSNPPEDNETRPKKIQKVGKGPTASCASSIKKANGLLKGRPILNDLVKNEA